MSDVEVIREIVVVATVLIPHRYYCGVNIDLDLDINKALKFTKGTKNTQQIFSVLQGMYKDDGDLFLCSPVG